MIVHIPEAFRERPKCVLLDLDNTLYDYDTCNDAGMAAARQLARSLLKVEGSDFDRCFLQARTDLKSVLGTMAASHSRLLYFQRTLEIAGFASQPVAALQLDQGFWRAYLDSATLFEEAVEFLDDLRMANIPAVIVSDQLAAIQMRKMVYLGLDKDIDWLVTSEETGADKPNPLMFTMALRKVEISEGPVWMIGDSLCCDMAGARAAINAIGIQKVHGTLRRATSSLEADAVFEHFADLRKLFARTVASDGGS